MTSHNDCFRDYPGDQPQPAKRLKGPAVPGCETDLWVVIEDDFAVGFQQPEFSDAWWFHARRDGCLSFGQMRDSKVEGGEHACDINQLIALLTVVRDYMAATAPEKEEPK